MELHGICTVELVAVGAGVWILGEPVVRGMVSGLRVGVCTFANEDFVGAVAVLRRGAFSGALNLGFGVGDTFRLASKAAGSRIHPGLGITDPLRRYEITDCLDSFFRMVRTIVGEVRMENDEDVLVRLDSR